MSEPERRWQKLGRRQLLGLGVGAVAAGGAGLALGFFGGRRFERRQMSVPPRSQPFSPSVFLAIDHDGATTVWVTRSEMGQGVSTALPMIVADALDADWRAVRIELAPASLTYGYQGTMASASVRSMHDELREAGGIARAMLLEAGAAVLGVGVADCDTRTGAVVHRASGRTLGYGLLASRAAALDVPSAPALRDEPRWLGRPTRRLDARDKAEGRAIYGLDVRRPGLRFASIERPRGLGGAVGDVAEPAARAVAGVLDVVRMSSSAVAVIAEHTHAAFAGRRALAAQHRAGPNGELSSARIEERLRAATEAEGAEVHAEGDAGAALAGAARRIEGLFEVPYLAHQCMEPINATARIADGACEVWAPTQDPMAVRELVAELTGLGIDRCTVHVTLLGGGFGRRTIPEEIREVIELARHTSPHPVQLVWMREDDVRTDWYRPAAAHRIEVGLSAEGEIVAWRDRVATPTHGGGEAAGGRVDEYAVDGARPPYRLGAIEVRWSDVASAIPTGIWRSVAHSYNAFAVEAMLDEIARALERDPLELRLALLPARARHRAVLEHVAERCGWAAGPPEGRARGLAVHECFGSVCAQVAEVSLEEGRPRVHRVWAAVECGRAINPLGVQAQIMGGIVFGLSAALHGKIDVEAGRVRQSNFHDAAVLRMDECPAIEVDVLPSDAAPAGIGEVGVPMIAPAVASAVARLRGEPVRRLPLAGLTSG